MAPRFATKLSWLAAVAAWAYLAAGALPAFAQTAPDPLVIPDVPALLPWLPDNQTYAYQAASAVAELNIAKIYMGPCTYRMMHLHIYADEVLVMLSGRLESVVVAPNNTVYRRTMLPGDNVVYPKGWMHYQFNPNCTQARTLLAFNAKAVGTVGVPLSLGGSDAGYLQAAYNVTRFPSPGAMWVVDPKCAKRCKLGR